MESISLSRYTNKIIGNIAYMLLNKPIGRSTDKEKAISGEDFATEMYAHKGDNKDIVVKINCIGGSVKYGWDMVDSIIETKAKTENIGFAYSMAGICLIVGTDRTAYPHARAMIHAPRRDDGKKDFHTELIMDQFRTVLKNHTKFTEAEINEMIDSGKDYFFDAKQMLEKGMIDRISNTGGYNNDVMSLSEGELYAYINQQETTQHTMEIGWKSLIAGFTKKETEAEQVMALAEMQNENASLKASKSQLETELASVKAENATLKEEKQKGEIKAKATELIANAKKAGKLSNLKAEDEKNWIEKATADFNFIKGVIDSMPSGKSVSVAAAMKESTAGGGDMTWDWLAKNDPERLKQIAESDPELYDKLAKAHIKQPEAK